MPEFALSLCERLNAPLPLVDHLTVVHGSGFRLVHSLALGFLGLKLDGSAVVAGAAVHDLGKVVYPEELVQTGPKHEEVGPDFLVAAGLDPSIAKIARTQGSWRLHGALLEDSLVALADTVWKGERIGELENTADGEIAKRTGLEPWKVWSELDIILTEIGERIALVT